MSATVADVDTLLQAWRADIESEPFPDWARETTEKKHA